MIRSFGSAATREVWQGNFTKLLPNQIQQAARRTLRMINNAQNINDLRMPPANRLEKLKGDLAGFYSIRINQQWRIVFSWRNADAYQVEIIDYHD